jgi:hypothetical protein
MGNNDKTIETDSTIQAQILQNEQKLKVMNGILNGGPSDTAKPKKVNSTKSYVVEDQTTKRERFLRVGGF